MEQTNTPQMTVEQLGEFLRANGYPIQTSTLKWFCRPSIGKGPQPSYRWGRRVLFDPQVALAWAKSRLEPIAERAA